MQRSVRSPKRNRARKRKIETERKKAKVIRDFFCCVVFCFVFFPFDAKSIK